jgi:hypothetical protein
MLEGKEVAVTKRFVSTESPMAAPIGAANLESRGNVMHAAVPAESQLRSRHWHVAWRTSGRLPRQPLQERAAMER